ncbi:YheU family protein [Oceanicoccus sp. KOV_DT_Chl]|uniref:YheU family protein n=1 Tax=Oceanicoccus sp. KOV_DT_Chl TaxID=1904639 RepID=UPI001F2C93A3|nr:YheU family protein [Oceanicoccus sp. KOV_DT_Chl]
MSESNEEYIDIPYQQLSVEVLQALIEEFITREGTDYGVHEYSLEQKVAQVEKQLSSGRAFIAFDPVSESCSVLLRENR